MSPMVKTGLLVIMPTLVYNILSAALFPSLLGSGRSG